ncbi:peptide MFS transporter [Pseudonocardia sp. GCM10023141]|uniref:peptide MFS transporter n=1 Tax=Pseudonocardia sp. GCM10023141 TaxID=3252653 RepID=UPI003614DD1D
MSEVAHRGGTEVLGHPFALTNLVSIETWERFSFYGMQSLLTIYLYTSVSEGGLGYPTSSALSITGAYVGAVYFSTIIGAWLADRLLGYEKVLFGSAVVVMVGHAGLAVLPGRAGLLVGCVCVALGAGGVKATSSAIVGELYAEDDPRKDAGFSIFYAGITVGAVVGPIAVGWLQSTKGFHYGFGAAAVGMALGLAYYVAMRRRMPTSGPRNPLPPSGRARAATVSAATVVVVVVVALTGLVDGGNLSTVLTVLGALAAAGYFAMMLTSKRVSRTERSRVIAFIPIWFACAAAFALAANTILVVYADVLAQRRVGDFTMPTPWVKSALPLAEVVLSIAFAALWSRNRLTIPSAVKAPIGFAAIALALFSFLPFVGMAPGTVPLLSLLPYVVGAGLGIFLLYPMGLSTATTLAPAAFSAQMVAVLYLAVSVGSALGGTLGASFFSVNNRGPFFTVMGCVALALALAYTALIPGLRARTGERA